MSKETIKNLGVIIAVSLLVLGGVWFFVANKDSQPTEDAEDLAVQEVATVQAGEEAPDFTATTVDGEQFNLDQWAGQPVWLLFNATWCGNCRAEIPDIVEAAKEYESKVNIVAVYMSQTDPEVKEYGDLLGVPYTQIADPDNQVAFVYGVHGLPTSVFISPDGTVEEVYEGALSPHMIDQKLEALLSE